MRIIQHSAFGLVFGTSLALSAALTGVACGKNDYGACAATQTCGLPDQSGGSDGSGGSSRSPKSEAGAADDDGHVSGANGGKGGRATTDDKGPEGGAGDQDGSGGKSGSSSKSASSRDDNGGEGTEPVHTGGKSGSDGTPASAGRASTAGASGMGGIGGMGGVPQTAGAAGGSSRAMAGMGGNPTEPPKDTTPPSITVVSPASEAKGVTSDTAISVTFSEAMNESSTVAAYTSEDLPATAVDFFWSTDGTVLTVRPKAPLTYADLTDPTASGKHYVYTIGAGAKDTAGNALGTDRSFGFTTLRHVTQALPVKSGGGVNVTVPESGSASYEVRCDKAGSYVSAGDDQDNSSILSLVAFDISSVPAGIVEWDGATLSGTLSYSGLNPYLDGRLGGLHAFSTAVSPDSLTWSSAMTDLGLFGRYASQTDSALDAQSAVSDDYAERTARGNLSEYVFHFDNATDDNDGSSLERMMCSDFRLTLAYLAP
jgi:hypothetical protein